MRQISRRTFLTATAALVSGFVVACRELSPKPPVAIRQLTPSPMPDVPTVTPRPSALAATPTRLPVLEASADGYVAVAPRVLRTGQQETVTVSLFRGTRPAQGEVAVALLRDGKDILRVDGAIAGRGSLPLDLAGVEPGAYELQVQGKGFQERTSIRVESGTLVFVETDKPIYKPGQTVHIRVLTLDPLLRPAGGEVTVEVMDAQGIKIFRQVVSPDEWGMAMLDLPLSIEPNLGVWKVVATVGDRSAQSDIRVERYVLPKYEITVELPKSWALPGEPIKGVVAVEYSFGKPVKGEIEIVGYRYVGAWEEYTRVTKPIDGQDTFELPAVQYASGSPADGGQASARLDITVHEQATGYEEQTSRLITIAQSPVVLRVIPESQVFKPGLPFRLLVVAETPDKQPVDARVELTATYTGDDYAPLRSDTKAVELQRGLATIELAPPAGALSLELSASAPDASGAPVTLRAGYSPSGNFVHVEQVMEGTLRVGDTARFLVHTTRETSNVYYEVLARGQVVFSDVIQSPEIAISLSPQMAPEARLLVYQLLPNAEVAADWLPFKIEGAYPQKVEAGFSQAEAAPGQELDVVVQTEGVARVGLAAVDRSVFILAENRLNLQQVFDELERLFMQPQAEIHDAEPMFDPFAPIVTPGAKET
ncbi:MAG TPA: MG2 domain-containing protein, partial [Herpetosiphonaceae bacterium]|nr:MG2 domain-containing protein [Herpetosiphonaceae bacterium]